MKQLFFIVLALFALARIQEKEADKVDNAICYVNANAGNGTDAEIEKAIQKAAKLYKLSVAEIEKLYQLNNK